LLSSLSPLALRLRQRTSPLHLPAPFTPLSARTWLSPRHYFLCPMLVSMIVLSSSSFYLLHVSSFFCSAAMAGICL
jgi:hypothetical protein